MASRQNRRTRKKKKDKRKSKEPPPPQPPRPTSDWSSLPIDLLEQIFNRLLHFPDHVVMRAACSNWRSFSIENNILPPSTPHLMLPYNRNAGYRNFFSLYSNKVYQMYLAGTPGKRCCSSPQGWLVLLKETTASISLLNPFTGYQILLPPFRNDYLTRSYPDMSLISKVVFSPRNYTAMALINGKLAFCKPGQWTFPLHPDNVVDIIHYNEQFFAVSKCFIEVFVISNQACSPNGKLTMFLLPETDIWRETRDYLVELSGELMLVARRFSGKKTTGFHVFKLDQNTQEWEMIQTLGNHALFVDANSVVASNSPRCRADCIYFISDYRDRDFGIFNLRSDCVEPFPSSCPVDYHESAPPPIWFKPSWC